MTDIYLKNIETLQKMIYIFLTQALMDQLNSFSRKKNTSDPAR
jgi:hypothetical protein